MDLAARKYNFIQKLSNVDEKLLEKLENVLKKSNKNQDWFVDLSIEQQESIETGLQKADNNEFVSHQTIMDKFAKWH